MRDIKRHINYVGMMLTVDENERKKTKHSRFTGFEVDSIRAIIDVAKALDTLLDSMDRLITTEEED